MSYELLEPKGDLGEEARSALHELSCAIGVVLTHDMPLDSREELTRIQFALYGIASALYFPGTSIIESWEVENLEQALGEMNEDLRPPEEFIQPGGSAAAAHCHVAFCASLKAERRVETLSNTEDVCNNSMRYLDRVSDFLSDLARYLNKHNNVPNVVWKCEHER